MGMIEMNINRLGKLDYQATEAINTLTTNLSFVGGNMKKILITSSQPQEGKSFVSINLMRSLASMGMNVVLVDADIRASALQGTYDIQICMPGMEKYRGLTGYLFGRCEIEDIIAQTNIPNAYMILAGRTVTNSLPLFNTDRLEVLLDKLAEAFDVVLVDTPPIGTIIDAAKISTLCDGTLFVVQSGADTVVELKEAAAQIEKSGCPIIGYVLNKFDDKKHGGRYYSRTPYYYQYGKQKKSIAIIQCQHRIMQRNQGSAVMFLIPLTYQL